MTQSVQPRSDVLELTASLERVAVMIRRLAATPDISLTTASTLRMLETTGPCRLSEMAISQGVTQPAMTQLVTRLERDGYAVRGSDPSDARVVLVKLTEAGRAMMRERRERRAIRMSELLDTLPDADRELIFGAVPALRLLATLGQSEAAGPSDASPGQ